LDCAVVPESDAWVFVAGFLVLQAVMQVKVPPVVLTATVFEL
jgi:hypothetical protein